MSCKTRWPLMRVLFLAFLLTAACQSNDWERTNAAGGKEYEQGRYGEAEKLWLAALEQVEKFGPQNPRLATSLNNLAVLYEAQGKYAEAEPLYKRSLAIWEKALGPNHPHVATGLNNLALLFKSQGKYAEAEPLYKRSLAIFEKTLGPNHPDIATSLENYAALLRKTNHDAEAAKLEARAKAIRAKHTKENPNK